MSLVFSWSQSEFTRFVVKYKETGLRPSLNRTLQTDTRAFSGLTDSLGGFPKFRESDSRGRLVKEASLYDPTSFD